MNRTTNYEARWINQRSTNVRFDGKEIDMAKVPPCVCEPVYAWYKALQLWRFLDGYDFVSDDELYDAFIALRFRSASCEQCLLPKFPGWYKFYNLAQGRKRRASMPKLKRKLNKRTRKMDIVDPEWDKD